jgi:hypothetical protein
MSNVLTRGIPRVLTALIGLLLIVTYFFQLPSSIVDVANFIPRFSVVIVAVAVGVGAITLLKYHVSLIRKREPGRWVYSIVMLVSLLLFVIVGLGTSVNSPAFSWIYNALLVPCAATTYAMWCFFIASACFRTLRARDKQAAVLLVSAILVMLSNAALGELLWVNFPMIGSWIQTVPMMAVFRALTIGIGLGMILQGIRVLLGREKGYIGGS